MYDIMIIGAGPAGLAASVYVARKRLNAVLVSVDIGGQLNWNAGVENYLGYQFIEGPDLIAKFKGQVDQFPLEQKLGVRVTRMSKTKNGFQAELETGEKIEAKTAIMTTGKRPKKLGVPGEDEFRGKGVTYCAICDGPLFADQRIAVVGGGNSALEAALDMVKIASHIDVIAPAKLVGDAVLIERLNRAKNVAVHECCAVQQIKGEGFVKGVVIKDTSTGIEKELAVGGVFVEIGLEPSSEIVSGLVKLNNKEEIPISCACETTVPGLFAAGDVTDVAGKQIIIAAGEGAKAALTAHRYLQYQTSAG